ncbi:DCL, chloroplastic-like protein [Drosera capensis]
MVQQKLNGPSPTTLSGPIPTPSTSSFSHYPFPLRSQVADGHQSLSHNSSILRRPRRMNLASMSPATATSTIPSPPPFLPHQITSSTLSPSLLSFPHCTKTASSRIRVVICCAVSTGEGNRTSSGSGGEGEKWEYWTRKPVGTPGTGEEDDKDRDRDEDGDGGEEGDGVRWVDWEDQILDDTIPLVDLARRILHGKQYQFGDKLNDRHHRALIMLLLPCHPDYEEKIGCGVDYITIGHHPQFEESRCFFIVRKDGTVVDFSYWKCIKGFVRKRYPLFAESFLLRHFYRRTRACSETRI